MEIVSAEPVEKKVEGSKTRRRFIKSLLGIGLSGFFISFIYPIVSYLKPPEQKEIDVSSVSAGKLNDFESDSGKIIRFGNQPVLVVKTQAGDVKAFSATCTHLDCTVQYKKEMGVIWCACHNGKYDLTGRNISGPPPRPLDVYPVNIKGEEIIISKKV